MKLKVCTSLIAAALAVIVTGCATTTTLHVVPASDWSTEFSGRGYVRTSITNDTNATVFFKVISDDYTVAQLRIGEDSTRTFKLAPGNYETKLRVSTAETYAYMSGPKFSVPRGTEHVHFRLHDKGSNVRTITVVD